MKKILFLILLITNYVAYSQTYIRPQLRWTHQGGYWHLQQDSANLSDWRNIATEPYVQGYVLEHGGVSYSAGNGLALSGGAFSLNSINGFISQGSNVVLSGTGTLADPIVISATGSGGSGTNSNVGSAYRWAIPNTQDIKTFASGYGFTLDSLTANTLTGKIDTILVSTRLWRQKGIDSVVSLLSSYALTSSLSNYVPITTLVSTGYGLLGGGQLNANRTHIVDTSVIDTKLWRQKGIDSVVSLLSSYFLTSNFNSSFDTRLALKSTTNLTEGTNLYYTDARARAALSLTFTTTGTSGAATGTYNSSTGALAINVPQYTGGSGLTGSLTVSLTDAATITTDASLGYTVGATYIVTLGGNRTIANPTNPTSGQRIIYRLIQDGSGNRTITWGSAFRWSDDIPLLTLSTAANYIDYISFVYNSTDSKWDVTGVNKGVH